MRLLGLDPGLRHTGWGVVEATGNRLSHVANGVVHSREGQSLAQRLVDLFRQLNDVLDRYAPDEAAVEESFVNKNPASTLKLGVARGVVLLVPAERGLPVFEYSANLIKKSVVGVGHADKQQIQMMVHRLLPGVTLEAADAADALAVAICHAHHAQTARAWAQGRSSVAAPLNTLSPPGRGKGEGVIVAPLGGDTSANSAAPSPRPSPRRGEGDLIAEARRKPSPVETERARRLRRDSTDPETILWLRLRDRRLGGAKFRRQEPILEFTVDFVCHEKRLIIEVDGGQHGSRVAEDERRTQRLEQAGFRVLRFWNNEVFDNLDSVLEVIGTALNTSEGVAR
jgi:crossover junction endodeoxyribonuclease RuvC